MSNLLLQIYCLPLTYIVSFIIALFLAWALIGSLFKIVKKDSIWRTVNRILIVPTIFVILYITVFKRQSGTKLEIVLMPFNSFVEAKQNEEIYRTMLMNVFLFVPFALTLVYSLSKSIKYNIIITIASSLVLSLAIEITQYLFELGRVETDDVICNTFGGVIGVLSYLLCSFLIKFVLKRKNCNNQNHKRE